MFAIPMYGAEGAASATVISEVMVTFVYLWFVKKYIGEFIYLSRIFLPWILVITFIFILTVMTMSSINVIIAVMVFMSIYYSVLYYCDNFNFVEYYTKIKMNEW
jgi:O-antigen/teichoic acid export membrane protein